MSSYQPMNASCEKQADLYSSAASFGQSLKAKNGIRALLSSVSGMMRSNTTERRNDGAVTW
jgi:hypothetical protein